MRRTVRRAFLAAAVLAPLLAASPAMAFDNYTFTAALFGGYGGVLDGEDQGPFDESALQLAVGMLTQDRTHAIVRLGRLEFDDDHLFANRFGAEVEYLSLAGEYRFQQPAYDFGLFVGIGAYRVTGRELGFVEEEEEEALGFALGATGDFDMTRHLSFVAEIDFHYALFDEAELYGVALAGLAVHF